MAMALEGMELFRFAFALFLFVFSGFLWSIVLFKDMKYYERIILGFAFTLSVLTVVVMVFSFFIVIVPFFIYLFIGFFMLLPTVIIGINNAKNIASIFSIPPQKTLIKILLLIGILAFVFFMTYLPHMEKNYQLPFHADEWIHWGYTRGFMDAGKISFIHPFQGHYEVMSPEAGFHVFLGCFTWLSGAELQTVFLLMPATLAVFTSLAAFSLGERSYLKFGLAAAFFTAFIPTSNRFLGPSFLVPLSLGLFLTLQSLLLLHQKKWYKVPLLFLILVFATIMHAPSALALAIILLCYALFLSLEKKFRDAIPIATAVIIPFVVAAVFIPTQFESGISTLFLEEDGTWLSSIDITPYLGHLGFIVLALFFIGIFLAFYTGGVLERSLLLSASAFFLIIYLYDHHTIGPHIMYDRAFSFLFLMMAVLAGYGLAAIRRYGYTEIKRIAEKRGIGIHIVKGITLVIPVLLCISNLVWAMPAHIDEPYYQVISEKQFAAFRWIDQNLDEYRDQYHAYNRAAVPPLKAVSFSAVSGVYTLSSSFWPRYGENLENDMKSFLDNDAQDTDFLEQNDIGLIYGTCENEYCYQPNPESHQNIYLYPGIPPVADFSYEPAQIVQGEKVTFTSTATTRYGHIIEHLWTFGDNTTSSGVLAGVECEQNEYVEAKNVPLNTNFTIDLWIRPHYTHDDDLRHGWLSWDSANFKVRCYKDTDNRIYFRVKDESGWHSVSEKITFRSGIWNHFAASYDGTMGLLTFYWNGKQMAATTGPGSDIALQEGTLHIGGWYGKWSNGSIRDVKIYQRMLTNQEILHNSQRNVITQALSHRWKLDDGGPVAYDSIGNLTATLHGADWLNEANHTFRGSGAFTVTLQVRNEDGLTDTVTRTIHVRR